MLQEQIKTHQNQNKVIPNETILIKKKLVEKGYSLWSVYFINDGNYFVSALILLSSQVIAVTSFCSIAISTAAFAYSRRSLLLSLKR